MASSCARSRGCMFASMFLWRGSVYIGVSVVGLVGVAIGL